MTQDTNGKVTNSQQTPQTRAKMSALSQQVTTKHILTDVHKDIANTRQNKNIKSNFMLSPYNTKCPQSQGLVPSFSAQAPMFCFISYFRIYAENALKFLDICAGSCHFMWPITYIPSHGPLEYMRSSCVDPSLYVFTQIANALKRLNICTGATNPSLFAYPLIGFVNALLVSLHTNGLCCIHYTCANFSAPFVVRSV